MKHIRHIHASIAAFGFFAIAQVASAQTQTLQNPLSVGGVSDFVALVLKVMVMIALPIITLFIVYSGFLFVSAQGNQEKLGDAKRNLLYVLIGSILILGAWVIATLIGGTVSQIVR